MCRRAAVALAIAAGLVCASASAAPANCPDYGNAEPAGLNAGAYQAAALRALSPAWDGDEQFRLTWFGGYITEEGKLGQTCCFSSSIEASLGELRDVNARVNKLEFTPARIDGKPVTVYVSFTILAVKTADGIQSQLLFNQLQSRDRFGIDYVAPQRIGQFPELSASEVSVEVEAQVSDAGTAHDSDVVQWETGSRQIRREIENLMDQQCFIPGKVKGVAQAMPYREIIDRRHQALLLY